MENALAAAALATPEDLARLVATFSSDDTFTVLYVLTQAENPVALEQLYRRFGADPKELEERLSRLVDLGLVQRKGRGFLATPRAMNAMASLEERLKHAQLPSIDAEAAVPGQVGAVVEIQSAEFCEAGTNNSTWIPVGLTVTAASDSEMTLERAAPGNERNMKAIARQTDEPHATPSQHYL